MSFSRLRLFCENILNLLNQYKAFQNPSPASHNCPSQPAPFQTRTLLFTLPLLVRFRLILPLSTRTKGYAKGTFRDGDPAAVTTDPAAVVGAFARPEVSPERLSGQTDFAILILCSKIDETIHLLVHPIGVERHWLSG